MLEKGKISGRQACLLLILGVLPTALMSLPAITTTEAGPDAWLSMILATLVGGSVILTTVTLGLRFPEETIVEYSGKIIGHFPGKIIGLLFVWFFLYLNAIVIREFGEFIVTVSMPETPIIVFITTILLISAMAVRSGLEVLGRISIIIFSVIVISFMTMTILITKDLDFSLMTPVLARGFIPPLKGALPPGGWMGETVAIAFILPYINKQKVAYKYGIAAILILAIFLLLAIVLAIATFGAEQVARIQFPTYAVARYISLGNIIERMESLMMLTWVAGVFLKISFYYYITVLAIAQWLKLRDYRPLVFPVGTILATLSILAFDNNPHLISFLGKVWGPYSIPIELMVPLILLIIARVRGVGAKS